MTCSDAGSGPFVVRSTGACPASSGTDRHVPAPDVRRRKGLDRARVLTRLAGMVDQGVRRAMGSTHYPSGQSHHVLARRSRTSYGGGVDSRQFRSPLRSRTGRAAVGLVVLATVVGGCAGERTEANAYAWKAPSHEATTLTVVVVTGGNDTDVRATVVSESDTTVVVEASYRRGGGSGTAIGLFREADAQLTAPIGAREVRNRDGSPVPEQKGG